METTQSWIANVEILNALLRKESWFNTFWARFSGNVDISQDDNGNPVYIPSGNPIEILNDYVAQGRDNMLIPFLSDLSGAPVYGDTTLKGTGEDQSMKWLRAYCNQFRKAVMKKSGSMSEQRQKVFKLMDEARPQLARWFTKWENQAVFQAFYEGVSPNLSTGTTSDGLGLVKRYHPNWYINDGAVLTTIGSEKTLKTNSDLDDDLGMTVAANANCDTAMSADILRELRVKVMSLKIPQMETKDGYRFWCIVMHPAQLASLQTDSDYEQAQRFGYMGSGGSKMPQLTGMAGYYAGFAIYEDIVGIREWAESDSEPGFFGATVAKRFDDSAVTLNAGAVRVRNAIVFGKGAIGKAVADDLHFTSEVDDHANTIELGGAVINGYNRADFFAETDALETSGDAFYKNRSSVEIAAELSCVNQSSLILATVD